MPPPFMDAFGRRPQSFPEAQPLDCGIEMEAYATHFRMLGWSDIWRETSLSRFQYMFRFMNVNGIRLARSLRAILATSDSSGVYFFCHTFCRFHNALSSMSSGEEASLSSRLPTIL